MLYNINVWSTDHKYGDPITDAICETYRALIKHLKFIKYNRIDVVLFTEEFPPLYDGIEKDIVGLKEKIVRYFIEYDHLKFGTVSPSQKIVEVYSLIFIAMKKIATANSWDLSLFEEVEEKVKQYNYKVPIALHKLLRSPDKSKYAGVEFIAEESYTNFTLEVYDKKKVKIMSLPLWKSYPIIDFNKRFFNSYSWSSPEIFTIADRYNEIFFHCNVEDGSVTIAFKPEQNTIAELEDLLRGMQYDTPPELRRRLLQFGN